MFFCFNDHDNGGESLTLKTKFYHNGDPDVVYTNQEISLQSYCNSTSINLCGAQITPEFLFKLLQELIKQQCKKQRRKLINYKRE